MGVRRRSPGAGPRRAVLEPNHGQSSAAPLTAGPATFVHIFRGQPRHITYGVNIQEAQRGMSVPPRPLLQTSAVDPPG